MRRLAAILMGTLPAPVVCGWAMAGEPRTAAITIVEAVPHAGIDCTCRAAGRDFHLGEEACLNGPQGPRMAVCEMVLNNTSWRFTERACPQACLGTPARARR